MDDNYKEIDDLSNKLYKSIENLTIKLKDNTNKGNSLLKDLDFMNKSMDDTISSFKQIQSQSKQIAYKLNTMAKGNNKELIKVKQEELEFLEKLRKLITKNKEYLSKSDLSLAILERLKQKKGFSTYKDKYDKRDEYNKKLYKYLSKSLDDLPKTQDTKKINQYKKEIGRLLDKLDKANKHADKIGKSNKALRDLLMNKKNGVWSVLDRKSVDLEGISDAEKNKDDIDKLKTKVMKTVIKTNKNDNELDKSITIPVAYQTDDYNPDIIEKAPVVAYGEDTMNVSQGEPLSKPVYQEPAEVYLFPQNKMILYSTYLLVKMILVQKR